MKKREKVIITCAVTGAAHTPCMSPHLPITPEQIADEAIAAAEAGAAMIHFHARDPEDGFPTTDPEVYREFLEPVARETNVIINITTNQPDRQASDGDVAAMFERRLAAPREFAPEVTSFNLGPVNPALWTFYEHYKDQFRFDWEAMVLTMTKGMTLINTHAHMEQIAKELGDERGVRFEFECFDIGHLHALRMIMDQGWVKAPLFIQSVFGFPGGLSCHPSHVVHMKQTADMLFGDNFHWSALAAGKDQIATVTMAAIMGGHVRVGMEDSLWYGKGELAKSNAEQVARIRRILEELSMEIATPDEARDMLQTKGKAYTNILPG